MIGILGNTVIEGKRRLKKLRSGQGSEAKEGESFTERRERSKTLRAVN